MTLKLKFWGVRGSIACATPSHMKYGGNTSCIEVRAGDHCFVLDAGTGIKNFGGSLISNGDNAQYTVVFATQDKSQGPRGISAFVVEKGSQGFQAHKQ